MKRVPFQVERVSSKIEHVPFWVGQVLVWLCASGCIKAPEIVLVDRATALEQQAAGSFHELELELARAAMAPQPAPLTPEQLEALGIPPPNFSDKTERTDADRVDDLLKQRCVGEGKEGLLADTPDACKGGADHAETLALVERTNGARQQLWRWMKERRPGTTLDQVRRSWREVHVQGVSCGGWLQRDDGQWEPKKC
jgi:hypothetical protein